MDIYGLVVREVFIDMTDTILKPMYMTRQIPLHCLAAILSKCWWIEMEIFGLGHMILVSIYSIPKQKLSPAFWKEHLF